MLSARPLIGGIVGMMIVLSLALYGAGKIITDPDLTAAEPYTVGQGSAAPTARNPARLGMS